MTATTLVLCCAAALLSTAILAVAIGRRDRASTAIYGLCLVVSLVAFAAALSQLISGAAASNVTLPLGLPWLGAHFRLDALAAFFLVGLP